MHVHMPMRRCRGWGMWCVCMGHQPPIWWCMSVWAISQQSGGGRRNHGWGSLALIRGADQAALLADNVNMREVGTCARNFRCSSAACSCWNPHYVFWHCCADVSTAALWLWWLLPYVIIMLLLCLFCPLLMFRRQHSCVMTYDYLCSLLFCAGGAGGFRRGSAACSGRH